MIFIWSIKTTKDQKRKTYSSEHGHSTVNFCPVRWIWFTPSLPDAADTKFWHELNLQFKKMYARWKCYIRPEYFVVHGLQQINVSQNLDIDVILLTVAPAYIGANSALKRPWTCEATVKDSPRNKIREKKKMQAL